MGYSAQANGFFSYPLPEQGGESEKQKALAASYFSPTNVAHYKRAGELGKRLGRSAAEVALAYLWSQSFPAVAIIGASRSEQLTESLAAADLKLSSEDVAFLETGGT